MIRGSTILGLAAVLPAGVLDNQEIARRFGEQATAAALKMSGIQQRRIAAPAQHASDLAFTAAERLLGALKFDRSLIDLLIFVSQTPDYRVPITASILQDKLGLAQTCASFDVNLACSAYPYALSMAHSMVVAGVVRNALILNAETVTRLIHPQDRSLVVLHGDGAAATIVGACGENEGFEGFSLGTDGAGAKHLLIPAGGSRMPCCGDTKQEYVDDSGCVRTAEHLKMNGPAVFHFSLYKVPEVIGEALHRLHYTMDDIDCVVLHQANKTMMDLIYKSLRVSQEKRFYCLETMGNLSGPSSPIALAEAWRVGKIKPGSRTLLCAFGGGLTWGVAVIHWSKDANPVPHIDPVTADEEVLSAAL